MKPIEIEANRRETTADIEADYQHEQANPAPGWYWLSFGLDRKWGGGVHIFAAGPVHAMRYAFKHGLWVDHSDVLTTGPSERLPQGERGFVLYTDINELSDMVLVTTTASRPQADGNP